MINTKTQIAATILLAVSLLQTSCSGQAPFTGSTKSRNQPTPTGAPGREKSTFSLTYTPGEKSPKSDYLFVLDNSVSMASHAAKVINGLLGIAPEVFPKHTRMGVMTTMVSRSMNPKTVHADIVTYPGINQEPGFLSLVNRNSIQKFTQNTAIANTYRTKYALKGCENGWFGPFETSPEGSRCFQAALQNVFYQVGCEAGLLAAHQFIESAIASDLFRDGANANLVFISDEQEGCKSHDTKVGKSYLELKNAIESKNSVAGVKIHGIVPASAPTGNTSYKSVIEAAQGVYFNIADNKADYRALVQQIIEGGGETPKNKLSLPRRVKGIRQIRVNGLPIEQSAYKFDGMATIEIDEMDQGQPSQIEVDYED